MTVNIDKRSDAYFARISSMLQAGINAIIEPQFRVTKISLIATGGQGAASDKWEIRITDNTGAVNIETSIYHSIIEDYMNNYGGGEHQMYYVLARRLIREWVDIKYNNAYPAEQVTD